MKVLLALVVLLAASANAASSGDVSLCDALSPLWGKSATGTLMTWADAPVRSYNYSVRTGDGPPSLDVTSYVPGEYTTIHVRTLARDMKYRGILIYAETADGQMVGDWELPSLNEVPPRPQTFWKPPSCGGKGLAHTDANLKNLHESMRFINPPAGTGKIFFRVLIKYGNANTGAFYWPMSSDLALTEHVGERLTSRKWVRSTWGQNCDEACSALVGGYQCDLAGMNEAGTAPEVMAGIDHAFSCKTPLLSLCEAHSPASSNDGWCYYHHEECGCLDTVAGCKNVPTTCEARGPSTTTPNATDGYRLCACYNPAKLQAELQAIEDAKSAGETGRLAGAAAGGAIGLVVVAVGIWKWLSWQTSKNTDKMASVVSL